MFRTRVLQCCVVALSFAITPHVAIGQAPLPGSVRPLSDTDGNAGTELNRIYARDIGTGYSGTSLNQIALNSARARVGNFGQQSTSTGYRGTDVGINAPRARNKPFSSFSPTPTVSPYLNLFREDLDGSSDLNYNTLVKPMLQQQAFNEQQQRQSMEISQRLQSISAQADFNAQGSQSQYPTGHQTTTMNYSHFYPNPAARGRR